MLAYVYKCMDCKKPNNIKVKNSIDQKISFQLTVHKIKTSCLHAYAPKFPEDISGYVRGTSTIV